MPEGMTGSTVPRRQLGRYLRDLRGRARMTIKASAEALEWSEAKMWRIETGQTSMRSLDVEAMCRVYGAPADTTTGLMALAKETKSRGWWMSYTDFVSEHLNVYLGLEEAVAKLSGYQSELVPGLFQTESYARTIIEADNPQLDDDEIDRRIQLRMTRKSLLTRVTNRPTLLFALNEAVLRRPVGGPAVMAEQLRHLAEVSELADISVRVVPFSSGLQYGLMCGPFILMEFPMNISGQPSEPTVAYVESFTGALFLDKPHEIARYDTAFASIWADSLSDKASRDYFAAAAKEVER